MSRRVTTAGSIFLGHYSCESAGDYASGTNHTLPTSGHAAAYSGVSLDSFVKKITFQQLTEEGVISIGNAVEIMAEEEQLIAHKNAMTLRLGAVKARQIAMTGYTQEQVQNQEQEQQIQQGESQASSQTERHDADELPQTEQQDDENGEF